MMAFIETLSRLLGAPPSRGSGLFVYFPMDGIFSSFSEIDTGVRPAVFVKGLTATEAMRTYVGRGINWHRIPLALRRPLEAESGMGQFLEIGSAEFRGLVK